MLEGVYTITNAYFHLPLSIGNDVEISPLKKEEVPNSALWKITFDLVRQSFQLQNVHTGSFLNLINKNLSMDEKPENQWKIIKGDKGYYRIFASESGSRTTSLKAGEGHLGSDTYSESDRARWSIRVVNGNYFAIISKVFEQYLCVYEGNLTVKDYGIHRKFLWEVIQLGDKFQIRSIKKSDQKLQIRHFDGKATSAVSTYAHGTSVAHSLWKINEQENGTYKIVNQATSRIADSDSRLNRDAHLEVAHNSELNPNIENRSRNVSWFKHGASTQIHASWIFRKFGPLEGLSSKIPEYIDMHDMGLRLHYMETDSGSPPSLGKYYLLEERVKELEMQVRQSRIHQTRSAEEAKNERETMHSELVVNSEDSSQEKVQKLKEQTERNIRALPETVRASITDSVAATVEAKFLTDNSNLIQKVTEAVFEKVLESLGDGNN